MLVLLVVPIKGQLLFLSIYNNFESFGAQLYTYAMDTKLEHTEINKLYKITIFTRNCFELIGGKRK